MPGNVGPVQAVDPRGAEGMSGFEGGGQRTASRLLEVEFPGYRLLLPSESAAVTEVAERVASIAARNGCFPGPIQGRPADRVGPEVA